MAETETRREHVAEAPLTDEGIYYARLQPGPNRNFVYLVADAETREAVVIDPAYDVARIVEVLCSWNAELTAALFTHNHPDHTEGAALIQNETRCTLYIHEDDAGRLEAKGVDVEPLVDGQRIRLGDTDVIAHHTPGHTAGGVTYQIGKRLFTGDFLFIGQAGRTDFPTGSKRAMWDSLQRFKKTFPDDHIICPGHDYGDVPEATVRDQKKRNSALSHRDYAAFEKEWYLVAY